MAALFQLGCQGLALLLQGLPAGVASWLEVLGIQLVIGLDVVANAVRDQFLQLIKADGVAGAELRFTAVGVELAAEIRPAGPPLPAVGDLAHGTATVHALYQAG